MDTINIDTGRVSTRTPGEMAKLAERVRDALELTQMRITNLMEVCGNENPTTMRAHLLVGIQTKVYQVFIQQAEAVASTFLGMSSDNEGEGFTSLLTYLKDHVDWDRLFYDSNTCTPEGALDTILALDQYRPSSHIAEYWGEDKTTFASQLGHYANDCVLEAAETLTAVTFYDLATEARKWTVHDEKALAEGVAKWSNKKAVALEGMTKVAAPPATFPLQWLMEIDVVRAVLAVMPTYNKPDFIHALEVLVQRGLLHESIVEQANKYPWAVMKDAIQAMCTNKPEDAQLWTMSTLNAMANDVTAMITALSSLRGAFQTADAFGGR